MNVAEYHRSIQLYLIFYILLLKSRNIGSPFLIINQCMGVRLRIMDGME